MFFEVIKTDTGYDIIEESTQQRFMVLEHIQRASKERWLVQDVDMNNNIDTDIAPEEFYLARSAMSYVVRQAKRKRNLLLQPRCMSGELGRLFDLTEIMDQAGRF